MKTTIEQVDIINSKYSRAVICAITYRNGICRFYTAREMPRTAAAFMADNKPSAVFKENEGPDTRTITRYGEPRDIIRFTDGTVWKMNHAAVNELAAIAGLN